MRGRRGPEVLVGEAIRTVGEGVMVLGRGPLWARPRLRRRLRRRSTIVLPAGRGACVCVARRRRRAASRRVRRVIRRYVQVPELPSLGIVLGPLLGVAQNLVRSLDLLKLGDPFLLVAGMPIGMALECQLAKRLADVVVAGGRRDAQVRIEVARRIDLGHARWGVAGRDEEGVSGLGERLLVCVCGRQTWLCSGLACLFTVLFWRCEAKSLG